MSIFNAYASYYNLLYHDKNYAAEADYLNTIIQKHHPNAQSILELGCGTGKHALLLAEKGYSVHGIDISEEMVQAAQTLQKKHTSYAHKLSFSTSDLRTLNLEKKYDVVASLFHVISYQTTNDDLNKAFQTASKHLNPGGLFVFDFWYGPAVLTQQPHVRIKRMEDNNIHVTRIAEPQHTPNDNKVSVNFSVYVTDKKTNNIHNLQETHHMRYLFKPELEHLFSRHEFDMLACEEWLTGKQPDATTWGVCVVGRKR